VVGQVDGSRGGGRRTAPGRRVRRVLVLLTAAVLTTSAGLVPHPAVAAEPSTPLGTAQIDGVAFAQVVAGDTVYVGGRFSTARPAGSARGTRTVVRRNLLAYRLSTGRLTGWAPRTNGVVQALAVSSDRRTIFAVGGFTSVDGHARQRLVALSTAGGVRAAFHPALNAVASAVAVHGSTVYVGGRFTRAAGVPRRYTAAFSADRGALRRWRPQPDGAVLALVVSPTGGSVVLGGRFGRVNGRLATGTVRIGTSVGTKNLEWRLNRIVGNHGADSAVFSLSSSHGTVYGTGYSYGSSVPHRLEGAFAASWRTGAVQWIEDCHGDSYSVARGGSTVHVVGHAHDCSTVGAFGEASPRRWHRALAFTADATGKLARNRVKGYSDFGGRPAPTLLDDRPDFDIGTATGQGQGPWSVITSGRWVLYAGEFHHVDGRAQQGLVRIRT
jgi:hypothetical protein